MSLGNKILELRKNQKLSQEQLAEKINVTRQTISNWELNETTPDLNQAKELSKVFNVSLDELTDNDVKNIVIEKVSNTEKLAGIVIKILKFIGIAFIVMLIIDVIAFILFSVRVTSSNKTTVKEELICTLKDDEYIYGVEYYEDNSKIISAGGDSYISDVVDAEKYDDAKELISNIKMHFEKNNGSCD